MKFTGERFIPDCGLESEIVLEHLQRYLAAQDIVADKKILDVASGAGYGTAILAGKSAYVCGLDIDREAVEFARGKYKAANLRYLQGSIVDLPFADESFDVVVSFETIEHVGEDLHGKFMDEVARVLKPDGFLIISTPDKHIYSELTNYNNEFHLKEYYRQEFYDFLRQFFPKVALLDQFQELAYTLTDSKADCCRILRRDSSQIPAKYVIAICGRQDLPDYSGMSSIIFDTERRYQQKVDRVVELQGEIVEKNGNIADCWDMIHERDDVIGHMKVRQDQNEKQILSLEKRLAGASEGLSEKEDEVCRLQRQLSEALGEMPKKSASLEHIHSTRAWRIIQKIYWFKNKLWPF
jgi:SAM-dependent methyltransferase